MLSHRGTSNSILSLLVAVGLMVQSLPSAMAQNTDEQPPFRILVIEGEGSINNIRQPVNRGAVVLVEDENKNPLAGVAVTFYLPSEGPSGLFPDGGRTLTVFTDEKGLAASRGIRFNNLVGLMKMRVTASLFSQSANAMVTQTNVSSAAAMRSGLVPTTGEPRSARIGGGGLMSRKTFIILGAVGGAVGAGLYFGMKKTTPTAAVTIGQPTIGSPR